MKTWTLPLPPGTNNLYRNTTATERNLAAKQGRRLPGRVRTLAYHGWRLNAGRLLMTQGPRLLTPGYVKLYIDLYLPEEGQRIDIDAIKAIPDLLTDHGLIEDDKLAVGLVVSWCKGERRVEIGIARAPNPWGDTDA